MTIHRVKIELEPDQSSTDDNSFPKLFEVETKEEAIAAGKAMHPGSRVTWIEEVPGTRTLDD